MFTLDTNTNEVEYENKDSNNIANQIWKLGKKDIKGWMTIQHSSTDLYLTTKYDLVGKGTTLTVENKGRFTL